MKTGAGQNLLRGSLLLASFASVLLLWAQAQEKSSTKEWPLIQPSAAGFDSAALTALDADVAGGKYGLVDSMLIIRDGKQVFARSYLHDYGKIYRERARHEGPLNHDVNGPYNY
jgi:hypothetical protein